MSDKQRIMELKRKFIRRFNRDIDELELEHRIFFIIARRSLNLPDVHLIYWLYEYPDRDVEASCLREDRSISIVIAKDLPKSQLHDKICASILHELLHYKYPEKTEEEIWKLTEEIYHDFRKDANTVWITPPVTNRTFEGGIPIEEARKRYKSCNKS